MDRFTTLFGEIPPAIGTLRIGLLGGGGKTSMLRQLGREYATQFDRVLMTSMTLSARDHGSAALFLSDLDERGLTPHFATRNPLCLMNRTLNEHKLEGVPEEVLRRLVGEVDVCVFECDGARNLPLKAHNDRDPMIPDFATHVLILVGADALGRTLESGLIHRPELFAERWDIEFNAPLGADFIAEVVTTRKGYLAKVPNGLTPVYFVNKADRYPEEANDLARAIAGRGAGRVFAGSVVDGICREVSTL